MNFKIGLLFLKKHLDNYIIPYTKEIQLNTHKGIGPNINVSVND